MFKIVRYEPKTAQNIGNVKTSKYQDRMRVGIFLLLAVAATTVLSATTRWPEAIIGFIVTSTGEIIITNESDEIKEESDESIDMALVEKDKVVIPKKFIDAINSGIEIKQVFVVTTDENGKPVPQAEAKRIHTCLTHNARVRCLSHPVYP